MKKLFFLAALILMAFSEFSMNRSVALISREDTGYINLVTRGVKSAKISSRSIRVTGLRIRRSVSMIVIIRFIFFIVAR